MRFPSVSNPVAARLAPTVLASALFACGVSACSSAPSAAEDTDRAPSPNQGIIAGTLEVKIDRAAKSLTLRNTTEFEASFIVVEKDMMTIALFPPCGQQCPILAQGATTTVPYTSVAGYSAQAKEARVMWWTYRRNADGSRSAQGAVNTINVVL
jgi:hypothetical protein